MQERARPRGWSTRIDRTKPASIVIDRAGGLTRFCEITGYPISTVQGWKMQGYIPPRRRDPERGEYSVHVYIMDCLERHGIAVEPSDFVDKPTSSAA